MAFIEINNLVKTYEQKGAPATEALRGINLSIESGSFLAIAGPSGSGKTTLLNLIGCLDKQTSGVITIDGVQVSDIPFNRLSDFRLKKIGFVFQSFNLFYQLTAIENVEYVSLLQGVPAQTRKEKALQLLEKVGLKPQAHKRPGQLSGGQQQRIAVARALATNPVLILADEPTANLDSHTAASLLDLMHGLNQESKTTFIFSTHDKMVMDKAGRVVLLKDGQII